jgi:hypothetical protein
VAIKDLGALTVVTLKNSVYRDIMPCSGLKANRRFGGTCLNCKSSILCQAGNQHEEGSMQRLHVPPKRRLTSNRPRSVVSQKKGVLKLVVALRFEFVCVCALRNRKQYFITNMGSNSVG